MTWVKYANISTSSNMTSLLSYANDVTFGWFWSLSLATLFIICLLFSYRFTYDIKKSLSISIWVTAIPGFLLMGMGLIPAVYGILLALLMVISISILFLSDNRY